MSTPPPLRKTIYTGTFISSPSLSVGELSVLENKALGVDESGVVVWIEDWDGGIGGDGEEVVRDGEVWRVLRAGRNEWWFPGFVGG